MSLDYNLFSIKTEAVLSLIGSAVQMAAFCYCLYLLWNGKILYGTMTLFLSQGAKLSSAFNSLVKTVPVFLNASVSATRIRELMAMPPEECGAGEDTLNAARGLTVRLEDVLDKVNFTAAPGEIVAVIGPSGGGKTTMVRMILSLIRPQKGRAELGDGYGQAQEMNAALRGFFSYVPQGNTLVSGTIADNLRMVKPQASDEEIEAALKTACAWEFVNRMENGADSSVGEHGHGLSEGQAQRGAQRCAHNAA